MNMRFLISLLFVVSTPWSLCAQEDVSPAEWYSKLMVHLSEPNQCIESRLTMTYPDGRDETTTYRYALTKTGFFARFEQREVIMDKNWFVNIDHDQKVMLLEQNSNEGDREERMQTFFGSWNEQIATAVQESGGSYNVVDAPNGFKMIVIEIPGEMGPYESVKVLFNPESLEIIYSEFGLHEYSLANSGIVGNPEKMRVEYTYLPFKKHGLKDNIDEVVAIKGSAFSVQRPYKKYKVYNLTNLENKTQPNESSK